MTHPVRLPLYGVSEAESAPSQASTTPGAEVAAGGTVGGAGPTAPENGGGVNGGGGKEARGRSEVPGERGSERALGEEALMQVGDLARVTGKTVRALHLYEELNLLRPAARSKGRYRLYGPEALLRIRWIGKLQDMGFSLTDIQTIVKDWEESASAPRAMVKMREVYTKKMEETRAMRLRLEALERELRSTLEYLDTCEVCEPARLLAECRTCQRHGCGEEHVPDLIAGFRAN